jgi:hypothetical protein
MSRLRSGILIIAINVLFLQSAAVADEVNVLREFGRINTTEVDDIYPYLGIVDAETGEWVEQNYDFYADEISEASEEVCTEDYWLAEHILCDEGDTRNSTTTITRGHESVGTTFEVYDTDAPFSYKAFQIVDLQKSVNIGALQVYQMFSDGKVTHVEMLKHSSTGDTWPTYWDAGWSEVVERTMVEAGDYVEVDGLEDGSVVVEPTTISFSPTNARYVMFVFYNDGSYGEPSWIEVGGVKLFGSLGKDRAFWSAVEDCRLDFSEAANAGISLTASSYQSCFFTGVNSSNVSSVNAHLQTLISAANKAGTPMTSNDIVRAASLIADQLDLVQRLSSGALVYAAEFEAAGINLGAYPTKKLDSLRALPRTEIDTLSELLAEIAKL